MSRLVCVSIVLDTSTDHNPLIYKECGTIPPEKPSQPIEIHKFPSFFNSKPAKSWRSPSQS